MCSLVFETDMFVQRAYCGDVGFQFVDIPMPRRFATKVWLPRTDITRIATAYARSRASGAHLCLGNSGIGRQWRERGDRTGRILSQQSSCANNNTKVRPWSISNHAANHPVRVFAASDAFCRQGSTLESQKQVFIDNTTSYGIFWLCMVACLLASRHCVRWWCVVHCVIQPPESPSSRTATPVSDTAGLVLQGDAAIL